MSLSAMCDDRIYSSYLDVVFVVKNILAHHLNELIANYCIFQADEFQLKLICRIENQLGPIGVLVHNGYIYTGTVCPGKNT